eukprot:CAMPEP_0202904012 /NCGR_PEP_ID=MMETSP1392-20130828/27485_1 /ASSEMBLY_ACC=CAM_ASM_000868 /TAXON_ID=225041 /ORGANISM="Chlamydomonas chlamydogama, Strain SAG 11-48b" /LENGTH=184 /DNA_ID=CAMNT_0049591443 /DNA_START=25 /DNA_END=579 /DNA_ORIENTATION=+
MTMHGLQYGEEGVQVAARTGTSSSSSRLVYSPRCGRVQLINVNVRNQGVDWSNPDNLYWKHQVARRETMRVVLRGQSEFEARDVTVTGDVTFEVPDGYRMVVTQGSGTSLDVALQPLVGARPTWEWQYHMGPDGAVRLEYRQHYMAGLSPAAMAAVAAGVGLGSSGSSGSSNDMEEEYVLDYVI